MIEQYKVSVTKVSCELKEIDWFLVWVKQAAFYCFVKPNFGIFYFLAALFVD